MVPLRIGGIWQRLCGFFSTKPKRFIFAGNKQHNEALLEISAYLEKVRKILNIPGEVVETDGRIVSLEVEGVIICARVDNISHPEDPHLACLIITADPCVFHVANEMFLKAAAHYGVRLKFASQKEFLEQGD